MDVVEASIGEYCHHIPRLQGRLEPIEDIVRCHERFGHLVSHGVEICGETRCRKKLVLW